MSSSKRGKMLFFLSFDDLTNYRARNDATRDMEDRGNQGSKLIGGI